jgi:hypothetical protein
MIQPFYDREIAAANVKRFRVPVIPGRPANGAGPGLPGHLERLISAAPLGAWPLADRWRALTR